jgi:ABC-2 type transport system permease protein
MPMSSLPVTWEIAKRSLTLIARLPSTIVPSLVMPVILTVAFTGAFSGLVLLKGHPADKAIDWFLPLYTMQGAAFAGVRIGMGVARDLSTGFYDRLLLSPSSRVSLLCGPGLAALMLGWVPLTLLVGVALAGGASFKGGLVGVATLAVAGLGTALIASAWSVGLALRFKTQQITPVMQTGAFLALFLSTAQMPLSLLTGWLHLVATLNPMTRVLALARQGFLGDVTWSVTWPGLAALAGLVAALGLFAYRGMQKVIP